MALRWLIRRNVYYDSVKLMRVSEMLTQQTGVVRAAAVMATPLNVELLSADGLLPPGIEPAPDDMLVAALGEDEQAADAALAELDTLLRVRPSSDNQEESVSPATAGSEYPEDSNLAVIAVPGQYAAAEAFAALRAGLHVFLFSDNVPVEEEVRLKALAASRDLLMMGPDCGTAIIGGVGLGFANRVESGPVGIVGASGTGIQQLCCLLDDAGIGIAHAIGTGGRDLSAAVGGSMTRRALWTLEADEKVKVIALVSKPASAQTSQRLQQEILNLSKPAVVCLLGERPPDAERVRYAGTLTEVAQLVAEALGVDVGDRWAAASAEGPRKKSSGRPSGGPDGYPRRAGRVYGLFTGGTLCGEAAQILDGLGVPHHLLDLGDDEYTRGRAHPIIDPRLRSAMLADLRSRDDIGAVLLDVVLGDLAHPDPVSTLMPAIETMWSVIQGAPPPVIAALIGTKSDPQGLEYQRVALEAAGVQVTLSNAVAAQLAGGIVAGVA